jgi:thiol-disulfide isomerase/thioredoxin
MSPYGVWTQVVVAFTVTWCALCRGYDAEFARAAESYAGLMDVRRSRAPLVFARVDVDRNRGMGLGFRV